MKPYFEALKAYIEKHPLNCGDADSVLGMLYECHNENNPYDNEQIKADFNELYQQMNGMPLREMDKEKLGEGVVVIASSCDGKVNLIAMATDEAQKAGAHAGNLIKAIAGKVGGGGGGRPNMAQAGGKNPAGIPDAIAEVAVALEGMLK